MFRLLGLFITFFLFNTQLAFASVTIKTEESIFENESVIDPDNVKQMISDSLVEELQAKKIDIRLSDYDNVIKLETKKPSFEARIVSHDFNKKSRQFEYQIEFSNGDFNKVLDFKGDFKKLVSIPTLAKMTKSGAVIDESDIEYVDIDEHRLQRDTITDTKQMIGKSLKYSKQALRPIRTRDVERKDIVERSDSVNIVYKTPYITLTAKGVAMDSGAEGDLIRIRNTSSNKIVQAKITDSSTAIVEKGSL